MRIYYVRDKQTKAPDPDISVSFDRTIVEQNLVDERCTDKESRDLAYEYRDFGTDALHQKVLKRLLKIYEIMEIQV